jgi:hypothetical protein
VSPSSSFVIEICPLPVVKAVEFFFNKRAFVE